MTGRESLPSRERGLKCPKLPQYRQSGFVAPLAGAWIEIAVDVISSFALIVAPLAGAWIEIA